MKMYEITELTKMLDDIMDQADEMTDEQQFEVMKTIDEVGAVLEEKVDAIAAVSSRLKADKQTLADEIKRLQARKKSIERQEERLREFLLYSMETMKIKKVKTAKHTVSLKACPMSLIIEPEFRIDEVDKEFVITEKKLNKTAVKDFYKVQTTMGENPVLPVGLKIVDNKKTVQIK